MVDVLSFGSEYGDVEKLRRLAASLNTPEYEESLCRFVGEGMPFAAARQAAADSLLGEELSLLLSQPNNNLGVEYLRTLDSLNSRIRPMTVRREGAPHDSLLEGADRPQHLSATQLRVYLEHGDWPALEPYLPKGGLEILKEGWNGVPSLQRMERGILAKLRTITAEDWAKLPDSGAGEGLPPRLERAGKQCRSLEEFVALAKPKHWTQARMRRLLVWAYLGLTQTDRPGQPAYLRVLGFNTRGQEVLRQMKERSSLTILTKPAHARQLPEKGKQLFELEARCTDLYDLCLETVPGPGREWTTGPVRM